jgi:hypothetical protein
MSFRNRKRAIILISLVLSVFINGTVFANDSVHAADDEIYILRNARIVHVAGTDPEELDLGGDVTAIYAADSGVYYIRHDDQGYTAGFYSPSGAEGFEFQLLHQSYAVDRFIVSEKIIYTLFRKPADISDRGGSELVRLNPDGGTVDTVDRVCDFGIVRGAVFILRGSEIIYNGISIPLMLQGELFVRSVVDDRLVLVGSNDQTEVCDVVDGRNIYQYGPAGSLPVNEDYNLVLEFTDTATSGISPDPEGSMVFYNIIVDGIKKDRTDLSPGRVTKRSFLLLDPGRNHLVRMERWELDRSKGRYVRANNIMQPAGLDLFIPENRGLKITVEFTGSGYNINRGVYRGDEK